MGFCPQCGDIVTAEKCKRWGCYGRAVTSIAAGAMSADGSAVDKWQSQYVGSIFAAAAETGSTGAASRRSSANRASTASSRRECAECNKRLFADVPTFVDHEDHQKLYCQSCHLKKFSLGNCRNCFKPVFSKDRAWVKYNSRYWHKDCFTCRHCQYDLSDDPLVDLGGLPCCEPCLEIHASERPDDAPTVHTPPSDPSFSPVLRSFIQRAASPFSDRIDTPSTSAYSSPRLLPGTDDSFWPDCSPHMTACLARPDSPQYSTSPPTRSASPSTDYSETSSRPSSPTSTYSFASSKASSRTCSTRSSGSSEHYFKPLKPAPSVSANRARAASLSMPDRSLYEAEVEIPVPSARLGRKISTPLLGGRPNCDSCHEEIRTRSVQVPNGGIYHQDCFTCAGCKLMFTESLFIMNKGKAYHSKCAPVQVEGMGIKCTKCKYPIEGQFIRNDGDCYHFKCFTCNGCARAITPTTPFSQINRYPYCETCLPSRLADPQPLSRASTAPNTSVPAIPADPPNQGHLKPSAIFTTRTKPLPKLGGSNSCPRCQNPVGYVEQAFGPRATKWHKKCLGCTGCKKTLDSAAIVIEDGSTWMPYCRNCHDKRKLRTKSPRFGAAMTTTRTALVN